MRVNGSTPRLDVNRRRSPKGFALLIVMVVGIAAMAAAMGLMNSSLQARVASVHSADRIQAEAIARAGMARSIEYLRAVSQSYGDLDYALDPDMNVTCDPATDPRSWTNAENGTAHTPGFTEAGVTRVNVNGLRYASVPYNGGAYLVRFDDDADDGDGSGGGVANTSNGCEEGSGFDDTNNPLRDRNNAAYITVIGIYPGTDYAAARHKRVLRRLQSSGGAPTGDIPAFTVHRVNSGTVSADGDIELDNGADFYGCSSIGRIIVEDNLEEGGGSQGCTSNGSLYRDGSDFDQCDATDCGTTTLGPDTDSDYGTGAHADVPNIEAEIGGNKDIVFDWRRPCLFFIDINEEVAGGALGRSLWFWDAGRQTVNGTDCDSYTGDFLVPDATDDDFAGCWTPLIVEMDSNCTWVGASATSEANDSGACDWVPNNSAQDCQGTETGASCPATSMQSTINTAASPTTAMDANNAALDFHKPAWGDECQFDFPAVGGETFNCTTCDGSVTNVALSDDKDPVTVGSDPTPVFFPAGNVNQVAAVPAGVYYFHTAAHPGEGDLNLDSSHNQAAVPGTPDETWNLKKVGGNPNYPLATIYARGSIVARGAKVLIGIGQGPSRVLTTPWANYPSIITYDGLRLEDSNDLLMIAGTILPFHDSHVPSSSLYMENSSEIWHFGEAHLVRRLEMFNNSAYHWHYTQPFRSGSTSIAGGIPPPLTMFGSH